MMTAYNTRFGRGSARHADVEDEIILCDGTCSALDNGKDDGMSSIDGGSLFTTNYDVDPLDQDDDDDDESLEWNQGERSGKNPYRRNASIGAGIYPLARMIKPLVWGHLWVEPDKDDEEDSASIFSVGNVLGVYPSFRESMAQERHGGDVDDNANEKKSRDSLKGDKTFATYESDHDPHDTNTKPCGYWLMNAPRSVHIAVIVSLLTILLSIIIISGVVLARDNNNGGSSAMNAVRHGSSPSSASSSTSKNDRDANKVQSYSPPTTSFPSSMNHPPPSPPAQSPVPLLDASPPHSTEGAGGSKKELITVSPSLSHPTFAPTSSPSFAPTTIPVVSTSAPTTSFLTTVPPTRGPTLAPSTSRPTSQPSFLTTVPPTRGPTLAPSTSRPTSQPTSRPTAKGMGGAMKMNRRRTHTR